MTKHKHAELIHQWADGAEIEFLGATGEWYAAPMYGPSWREDTKYRIRDPYRELKEALAAGKQVKHVDHTSWKEDPDDFLWSCPPEDYEIRDKPKKVVTSECWRAVGGSLLWFEPGKELNEHWQRFPAGDITGEVED